MRLLLLALSFALTGCAAQNIKELQSEGVTTVLTSPLPWQDAYRVLNTQVRQCWATSGIGAAAQADSQLYADSMLGEITVNYPRSPLSGENGPLARIQVRPAEAGSTVEVLTKRGMFGRGAPERVSAWLSGSSKCR